MEKYLEFLKNLDEDISINNAFIKANIVRRNELLKEKEEYLATLTDEQRLIYEVKGK